ncbi:MAG: type II secretion system protein [Pyrinomonadaceae bacterium]
MANKRENGFSLIEILVVCVVIGIIATIAIPYLRKAVQATENRNTRTTLKAVATSQLSYVTQNNRYARLTEINNLMNGSVGTVSGTDLTRGPFTISMVPASPTDAELRAGYIINATRNVPGEGLYIYEVTEAGRVRQVQPVCSSDCE